MADRKPRKWHGRRFFGRGYNEKGKCRFFVAWIGFGNPNCN
ncbi:hypothetical protein [Flavobacterium jejuense]|nr:hypothetical protein [Flavobacterium jejuense]